MRELVGGAPLDCEGLTEQEYSFTAFVYFFVYNHTVRGRDECPFMIAGVGGSLKTTIVSPCLCGLCCFAATALLFDVWMLP